MSDRFGREPEREPERKSRPRCAICRGPGWVPGEGGMVRCSCNPGESIRAWHGGRYGDPEPYPDEPYDRLRAVPNLGGNE